MGPEVGSSRKMPFVLQAEGLLRSRAMAPPSPCKQSPQCGLLEKQPFPKQLGEMATMDSPLGRLGFPPLVWVRLSQLRVVNFFVNWDSVWKKPEFASPSLPDFPPSEQNRAIRDATRCEAQAGLQREHPAAPSSGGQVGAHARIQPGGLTQFPPPMVAGLHLVLPLKRPERCIWGRKCRPLRAVSHLPKSSVLTVRRA